MKRLCWFVLPLLLARPASHAHAQQNFDCNDLTRMIADMSNVDHIRGMAVGDSMRAGNYQAHLSASGADTVLAAQVILYKNQLNRAVPDVYSELKRNLRACKPKGWLERESGAGQFQMSHPRWGYFNLDSPYFEDIVIRLSYYPGRTAHTEVPLTCETLNRVLEALQNRSIRGRPEHAENRWYSTINLEGQASAWTSFGPSPTGTGGKVNVAAFQLLFTNSETEAAELYNQVKPQLDRCVPTEWHRVDEDFGNGPAFYLSERENRSGRSLALYRYKPDPTTHVVELRGVTETTDEEEAARSPYELLKEHVTRLRLMAWDTVLREKVIKLAQTLDPKPAVPEEIFELAGRGEAAMAAATDVYGFQAAVDAFKKAVELAPWEATYYYNLGVALEKAKQYDAALQNFRWYLVAAPDAEDANTVRAKIGGLKFLAEKTRVEEKARNEAWQRDYAKRQNFQNFRQLVEGKSYVVQFCNNPEDQRRGTVRGCNLAEYKGQNWYAPSTTTDLRFHWEFAGDSATFVRTLDGYKRLRAHAAGSTLNDIIFEVYDDVTLYPDGRWVPLNSIRFNNNLSVLTYSTAKSVDEPERFPDRRYQYSHFFIK